MVRDVFDQPKLEQLVGNMGVGHGMSDTEPKDDGSSFLPPFARLIISLSLSLSLSLCHLLSVNLAWMISFKKISHTMSLSTYIGQPIFSPSSKGYTS